MRDEEHEMGHELDPNEPGEHVFVNGHHSQASCVKCATMQPNEPSAEPVLVRYGLEWTGPMNPVGVPMTDGYWTPWHIADRINTTLRAEVERLEGLIVKLRPLKEGKIEPASDPLQTMDAQVWAKEFMRIWSNRWAEVDEGLMIGWFANAIMRGFDEADQRSAERHAAEVETLKGEYAQAEPVVTVAASDHSDCRKIEDGLDAEITTLRATVAREKGFYSAALRDLAAAVAREDEARAIIERLEAEIERMKHLSWREVQRIAKDHAILAARKKEGETDD